MAQLGRQVLVRCAIIVAALLGSSILRAQAPHRLESTPPPAAAWSGSDDQAPAPVVDRQANFASLLDEDAAPVRLAQGQLFGPLPPAGTAAPAPRPAVTPLTRTTPRLGLFGSLPTASIPNVIGDFFGGGTKLVFVRNTVTHGFHTTGTVITGGPLDPNSLVAFERDATGTPNDFFTVPGTGVDATGDGFIDTFEMTEPLPPNEVPTSPGPGYVYDGGTVAYTIDDSTTVAQDGAFVSGQQWFASYSFTDTVPIDVPGGGSAVVGRTKIAENNSPFPRDRYFFDYRFFRDVIGGVGDVNRYTFGIEKTLFSGTMSLEARFPYAATLDSDQFVGGVAARDVEFGNISLILKKIVAASNRTLYAAGLGLTFPSGNDARVFWPDGTMIVELGNESVHLLPYVASLWMPDERFFLQSFLQLDIDPRGNTVRGDLNGGRLPVIGVLQESNLLLADLSGGYWLFQNPCQAQHLAGLAAIGELHYASTLQDADLVTGDGLAISDITSRLDVLNGTVGLLLSMSGGWSAQVGFTFPLRDDHDRQFDNEWSCLINGYF